MEYKPLEYFGSDGKIAQRMPDQWVFEKKMPDQWWNRLKDAIKTQGAKSSAVWLKITAGVGGGHF
jgi:hypothetical protein